MLLNIKYFGLIAELTQCSEESLEISGATIRELRAFLCEKYPELKNKDFQIAQNLELVSEESRISSGEIALLPPFSGG